ncbi:hypothetical protein GJ744_009742 [Endocarpon pusillum]|uniref:Uncharacterized protein n=1 Tax=Endocarpon pusillum TaxID=364733 RepID=A0A8H7AUM1_9EURO|nr:hypothetical protein GJ744_009742 [Endocarpon pusillum]
MSISRLNASWLAGHNENTLALANVNLNFALIKIQPPSEYSGLGMILSSSRRRAAEDGELHQTARKLSVLFRPLLPKTPALLKVYGKRVSEISKTLDSNRHTGFRLSAMFSDWVGIDATSIWAAATSGPAAITVHLVACMIARVFTTSEATSLWYELVERRKEQLVKAEAEGMADDSDMLAARCDISRTQLAEWDASARAWLQSADEAMAEKQTRLMRAIEELRLPIENDPALLDSVMKACTAALESMEKLIGGTAQRVQSPAVLLGLSCWHIYPDLLVLGTGKIEPTKQQDPLVSDGGLLTIGMQLEGGTDESIFWSLPLSFLRRYGDPVVAQGYIGPGHSRISLQELIFITMGCLFGHWGSAAANNDFAASWVTLIYHLFRESKSSLPARSYSANDDGSLVHSPVHSQSWLSVLNQAATTFIDAQGEEKREYQRLISLGRRKRSFLGESKFQTDPSRVTVTSLKYKLRNSVDRTHTHQKLLDFEDESYEPMFGFLGVNKILYCLDTPEERIEFLRKVATHKGLDPKRHLIQYDKQARKQGRPSFDRSLALEFASVAPVLVTNTRKRGQDGGEKLSSIVSNIRWRSKDSVQLGEKSSGHEERFFTAPEELFSSMSSILIGNHTAAIVWLPEHTILDNAVLVPNTDELQMSRSHTEVSPEDMKVLLQGCHLNRSSLQRSFQESGFRETHDVPRRGITRALLCVGNILRVYKLLPGATISTKILQRPIPEVFHPKRHGSFVTSTLSRKYALALVAYCESGYCILDPPMLDKVFALSTGNSIFVYGALLSDPAERVEGYELRRLHGNIGRPGIALMISPTHPRVRASNDENWRVINHDAFDSTAVDSFESTSLHIWFTNYVLPLAVQSSGNRDSEAYLLESVISIHDNGKWVADVDMCDALANSAVAIETCHGKCLAEALPAGPYHDTEELTAIDCWEELLDPPMGDIIVRAQNNWVARLALLSVAHQLSFNVLVLPKDFCYRCFNRTIFAKYILPEMSSALGRHCAAIM